MVHLSIKPLQYNYTCKRYNIVQKLMNSESVQEHVGRIQREQGAEAPLGLDITLFIYDKIP